MARYKVALYVMHIMFVFISFHFIPQMGLGTALVVLVC